MRVYTLLVVAKKTGVLGWLVAFFLSCILRMLILVSVGDPLLFGGGFGLLLPFSAVVRLVLGGVCFGEGEKGGILGRGMMKKNSRAYKISGVFSGPRPPIHTLQSCCVVGDLNHAADDR